MKSEAAKTKADERVRRAEREILKTKSECERLSHALLQDFLEKERHAESLSQALVLTQNDMSRQLEGAQQEIAFHMQAAEDQKAREMERLQMEKDKLSRKANEVIHVQRGKHVEEARSLIKRNITMDNIQGAAMGICFMKIICPNPVFKLHFTANTCS